MMAASPVGYISASVLSFMFSAEKLYLPPWIGDVLGGVEDYIYSIFTSGRMNYIFFLQVEVKPVEQHVKVEVTTFVFVQARWCALRAGGGSLGTTRRGSKSTRNSLMELRACGVTGVRWGTSHDIDRKIVRSGQVGIGSRKVRHSTRLI